MATSKPRGSPAPAAPPTPAQPEKRVWRWWQNEKDGPKRCLEEFSDLPLEARTELTDRIGRFLSRTTRSQDLTNLGGGISELRCRLGNNHYRILFACFGPYVVGLTAFYKNSQKVSANDLKRAKQRAARWNVVFIDAPKRAAAKSHRR